MTWSHHSYRTNETPSRTAYGVTSRAQQRQRITSSLRSLFDQLVSRTRPFSDLTKLVLCFEPVVAVMPMSAATSLPDLVRAILYFFIKGERQMMSFEVSNHSSQVIGQKRAAPGKLKRTPVPPSLTVTVSEPQPVASPVAGSAL